ncbi:MAG: pantoate kinase [Candidatus Methanomethylicaceae archaeon]
MNEAESYVPSHITGFFKIHISDNPILTGSTGVGICLSAGLKTFVKIKEGKEKKLFFNDIEIDSEILNTILNKIGINENISIIAKQYSPLPIGYGYGMSGASLFGLTLAINKALGEPLKKNEVGKIAHIIEVERKTGLGDILAQTVGGFVIRTKPGAPNIGEVKNLPYPKEWLVITTPVKKINTSEILKNPRINEIGEECFKEFLKNPIIENFVNISNIFWKNIGLIDEDLIKIMKIYENLGIKYFSFKKGIVYGIIHEEDFQLNNNWTIIEKNGIMLIISRISNRGAF